MTYTASRINSNTRLPRYTINRILNYANLINAFLYLQRLLALGFLNKGEMDRNLLTENNALLMDIAEKQKRLQYMHEAINQIQMRSPHFDSSESYESNQRRLQDECEKTKQAEIAIDSEIQALKEKATQIDKECRNLSNSLNQESSDVARKSKEFDLKNLREKIWECDKRIGELYHKKGSIEISKDVLAKELDALEKACTFKKTIAELEEQIKQDIEKRNYNEHTLYLATSSKKETYANLSQPYYCDDEESGKAKPTTFRYQMEIRGNYYTYYVAIKDEKITQEYLAKTDLKTNSSEYLFKKDGNHFECINDEISHRVAIAEAEDLKTVLAIIAGTPNIKTEEISSVYQYILSIAAYEGIIYDEKYALDITKERLKNGNLGTDLEKISKLFNYFGSPVKSIVFEKDRLFFVYKNKRIAFESESTGNRKLYGICFMLLQVLESGQIMVIDELESGLHENLSHRLIELIQKAAKIYPMQILFTTHNTNLLDQHK